jgi:cobalt/nickel transport system permease protein
MKRGSVLFLAGLAATMTVAVVLSQLASDQPDALEYVAEQEGFIDDAREHSLGDGPLADYGGDSRTNLAVAGLVGVLVTLGAGYAIFRLATVRKREPGRQ